MSNDIQRPVALEEHPLRRRVYRVQWRFIDRCPVHGSRLRRGCRICGAPIPYLLSNSMATHPLSCARCSTCWVPALDRPAGTCTPVTGRAARILRRWEAHIASAMMPIATASYQPRDQATGPFVTRPAPGIEMRMTCLARHLRLLNRLYDVPPPSPAELLRRHCAGAAKTWSGRVSLLSGDDRQTGGMPYLREDWPHFGDDFLAYEDVLKRVGHGLFGDTHRIAVAGLPWASRHDEFVVRARDMDADHATALGWSISWYGFSRTRAPDVTSSMPAVGLTGWLANAPHRPADVPSGRWRDQMFVWLAEDVVRSAWAWSRIVLFMQARGRYLLHGRLARPSELAELHPHTVNGL